MDTSDSTTLRRCNTCKQSFPLTAEYFHRDKNKRSGFVGRCKACIHVKTMEWYSKPENAEHSRKAARQWVLNNPEKKREYEALTYEHRMQVKREWRKANPAKVKQHKNESQKRNRASANERGKRWRERNPDKSRETVRIQQHRRRHAPGKFTRADIELQLKSQRGKCWWCSCALTDDYHIDHRIPLSRGGGNNPENLCISCPDCNRSKSDKLPSEWNGRLL